MTRNYKNNNKKLFSHQNLLVLRPTPPQPTCAVPRSSRPVPIPGTRYRHPCSFATRQRWPKNSHRMRICNGYYRGVGECCDQPAPLFTARAKRRRQQRHPGTAGSRGQTRGPVAQRGCSSARGNGARFRSSRAKRSRRIINMKMRRRNRLSKGTRWDSAGADLPGGLDILHQLQCHEQRVLRHLVWFPHAVPARSPCKARTVSPTGQLCQQGNGVLPSKSATKR